MEELYDIVPEPEEEVILEPTPVEVPEPEINFVEDNISYTIDEGKPLYGVSRIKHLRSLK